MGLKDLVSLARGFDVVAEDSLERLAAFAQSVMTNVGAADLVRRVRSLARGTARKPPTDVERVGCAFVQAPSHRAAVNILVEIGKEGASALAERACEAARSRPAIEAI